MFLVRMSYPQRSEEIQILRQTTVNRDVKLNRLIDGAAILDLQRSVRDIPVSDHVLAYCIDLVRMTRPSEPGAPDFVKTNLTFGAGPRAGQYLVLAAKAWAALEGRLNVSCADVRRNAHSVLSHRIACNFHAAGEGIDATQIIDRLLKHVPEPDSTGI
jgi:MoxR-like ATPase